MHRLKQTPAGFLGILRKPQMLPSSYKVKRQYPYFPLPKAVFMEKNGRQLPDEQIRETDIQLLAKKGGVAILIPTCVPDFEKRVAFFTKILQASTDYIDWEIDLSDETE